MFRRFLRKIVIIGTTGSGKTTFLQALVGPFKGTEVQRDLSKESSNILLQLKMIILRIQPLQLA